MTVSMFAYSRSTTSTTKKQSLCNSYSFPGNPLQSLHGLVPVPLPLQQPLTQNMMGTPKVGNADQEKGDIMEIVFLRNTMIRRLPDLSFPISFCLSLLILNKSSSKGRLPQETALRTVRRAVS